MAELHWNDRVYGESSITHPDLLNLIESPTFRRLRGIRQAGPSAIAFPFKTVTRYEHCLGVHLLLRRLGADWKEQVAGLLHDVSHTAFSHAVDFVISSEEQDHHERLKPILLNRPDIKDALARLGFQPADFYDDSVFPLLERPLPWLCADRLDYFMRDGLACGEVERSEVEQFLGSIAVADSTIVLTDLDAAQSLVASFSAMNEEWWAGPIEAFIYNEFADVLREGLRRSIINEADLLTEDDAVLAKLDASGNPVIAAKLETIRQFHPDRVEGYAPRVIPKTRWLDPPVQPRGTGPVKLLSEWLGSRRGSNDLGVPERAVTAN